MRTGTLRRDITAGELAMDAHDGDGYPADHVIGRAGTTIRVLADEDLGEYGDGYVEVDSFSEDPFAVGWIGADDIALDNPAERV